MIIQIHIQLEIVRSRIIIDFFEYIHCMVPQFDSFLLIDVRLIKKKKYNNILLCSVLFYLLLKCWRRLVVGALNVVNSWVRLVRVRLHRCFQISHSGVRAVWRCDGQFSGGVAQIQLGGPPVRVRWGRSGSLHGATGHHQPAETASSEADGARYYWLNYSYLN